ncbi:MAG: 16S rRNA (adenine(1518)-N(6)/adenine(1519)-N(6))-dimethyltransferase RsmA [Eubacteriales bacterium]|jgi:16S rRNA (adenine1518-N6/adenine1519-N6)-dimethyltransferase|nr:16S rRNA (adenine(1518)-N(6)/adenine(1519)-N(6))-dimethyltransferase RsmA [Eubacteriales bacterium]
MKEPKLTDIKYVKQLMREYGLAFQKKFGQNFLINEAIPRKIAQYVSGNVIEIGPGIGTLTRELALRCKKVAAIEIDSGLIPILDVTLSNYPNVLVINADILKCDLPELIINHFADEPVSVCANLPYNITTPVIMMLLTGGIRFSSITVMIQKEVCDRFCAEAGTGAYSAVSAVAAYYAHTERLFGVSAGNFLPKPKVDSAVMRFLPYENPPVKVTDPDFLIEVIHAAFAQRRKTLSNALYARYPDLDKNMITEAILSCGFPADIRGERLNIVDFASLSDKLFILIK